MRAGCLSTEDEDKLGLVIGGAEAKEGWRLRLKEQRLFIASAPLLGKSEFNRIPQYGVSRCLSTEDEEKARPSYRRC